MSSVGETLRRERLRAGLDLERIAQQTKISVHMLELIESDRFESLPGGVFTKSFVRQFARAVGLDAEEVVAEFEKMFPPASQPYTRAQDAPRGPEIRMPPAPRWNEGSGFQSNSSLPALALVVLVMLACSGAYTLWLRTPKAPATPTNVAETAPALTGKAAEAAQAPAVSSQATPPPTQSVTGTITADNATGQLHIALTAEEETWVRATANGKVVFSGVLQPNETKALSAGDTVTLRIGNAGGVAISLNGKTIPAVGPRGQVRIVQLSPDGAVQVEPPPKPPATQAGEQKTQTL